MLEALLIPGLLFCAGLLVLYLGAEGLVRGGVSLAMLMGIRPLVIGLTIVSIGTSLPEFVVSVLGALQGSSDLAIGNIVGSNIANIALVLGASALIRPLSLSNSTIRFELPIMIGISLAFFLMALDGLLSRLDGVLLLLAMIAFLYSCLRSGRNIGADEIEDSPRESGGTTKRLMMILVGMLGLVGGAQLMVHNGIEIARYLQVPELVIGLSVLAIGTSLPELMTSCLASWRNNSDISVGNVLGSNIFNLSFVCGMVALIQPIAVSSGVVRLDLPIMMGFSLALYPLAKRGLNLTRLEGLLLLGAYFWYISYIFLQ